MSKLSLPIKIQKSSILTQHPNDLYSEMNCLYKKYVQNGHINISDDIGQELEDQFNDISDETLMFNVMDECAIEILSLTQNSFVRFVKTNNFQITYDHKVYGDDGSSVRSEGNDEHIEMSN
eukprot:398435_1